MDRRVCSLATPHSEIATHIIGSMSGRSGKTAATGLKINASFQLNLVLPCKYTPVYRSIPVKYVITMININPHCCIDRVIN